MRNLKRLLYICCVAASTGAIFYWFGGPDTNRSSAQIASPVIEPDGGGQFLFEPKDEITDEQREAIKRQLQESIQELERRGVLAPAVPQVTLFSWPVSKAPGVLDYDVDGISNFVDQNLAFPNQVLDWNCGNRSYDQASGYNHKGIDIFTWPFGWKKMDNLEAEVRAAAPGTIILKSDGNFDRSCGFNSNNWNAIYVRHADNSVAWYGHMKNGSLTSKVVGDSVVTGEKLGIIGSSGNSTGPHLHFEIYNSAGQLQDPYQGSCNSMNAFTWWAQQPAYRVSRVNTLLTQSAPPVFPTCPQQEISNEKNSFRPGETLYTAAYYRDQLVGQQTQYSITRPDGTTFTSWTANSPNNYSASYWWWSWVLPANAGRGSWRFKATFDSQTYERVFGVTTASSFDYDRDWRADLSVYRPSDHTWYLLRGSAGFMSMTYGIDGDKMVPADYDGDGKTDVAMFRPSNGVWYIFNSASQSFTDAGWGQLGDIPVPSDHNGDGKADLVIFRPSTGTWYVKRSDNVLSTTVFGTAEDKPVVGDFDGDGRYDIGVFRQSDNNWYTLRTTEGFWIHTWGQAGDIPVPADYDGDGETDIAVFRPATGEWFRILSNSGFDSRGWGQLGDKPVAADYDGDGKADIGVFRSSNSMWYISGTSAGIIQSQFGTAEDQPTAAALIY